MFINNRESILKWEAVREPVKVGVTGIGNLPKSNDTLIPLSSSSPNHSKLPTKVLLIASAVALVAAAIFSLPLFMHMPQALQFINSISSMPLIGTIGFSALTSGLLIKALYNYMTNYKNEKEVLRKEGQDLREKMKKETEDLWERGGTGLLMSLKNALESNEAIAFKGKEKDSYILIDSNSFNPSVSINELKLHKSNLISIETLVAREKNAKR